MCDCTPPVRRRRRASMTAMSARRTWPTTSSIVSRDEKSPPALRVLALQMVPAGHPKLTLDLLSDLLSRGGPALRLEAVRSLSDHPNPGRIRLLLEAIRNARLEDVVRAQAVLGASEQAQPHLDELLKLARGDNPVLRDEALRALKDTRLSRRAAGRAGRGGPTPSRKCRPDGARAGSAVRERPFPARGPRRLDEAPGGISRCRRGPAGVLPSEAGRLFSLSSRRGTRQGRGTGPQHDRPNRAAAHPRIDPASEQPDRAALPDLADRDGRRQGPRRHARSAPSWICTPTWMRRGSYSS